jgi:hypothetical protein
MVWFFGFEYAAILEKGYDGKVLVGNFLKAHIVGDNRAGQVVGGGIVESVGWIEF